MMLLVHGKDRHPECQDSRFCALRFPAVIIMAFYLGSSALKREIVAGSDSCPIPNLGPKIWNSLPATISPLSSFPNLKKKLLEFLVK